MHILPELKQAAVVLFVTEEEKYVSVSRKGSTTLFGLPGGKVDLGESVEHAAVREIAEELGIDIAAHDLIPVFSDNDGGVWATAFLYNKVMTDDQVKSLVPEETTTVRLLSREQLSSFNISPFAGYNHAAFSNMDLLMRPESVKEYSVELTTWENDADHYKTQTIRVATIDEARFLKEVFFNFESRNSCANPGFGNNNVEIETLREFFMEQLAEHPGVKFSNMIEHVSDDLDDDSITEIIDELLGAPVEYEWGFFGEGPFCRVAERFEVYRKGVLVTDQV